MGSPKIPRPTPTPPTIRNDAADARRKADEEARAAGRRYDFANTIIAGSGRDNMRNQSGLKSTLA